MDKAFVVQGRNMVTGTTWYDTETDNVAAAASVANDVAASSDSEVTVFAEGDPHTFEEWGEYLRTYIGCLNPETSGDLRGRLIAHHQRTLELLKSAA